MTEKPKYTHEQLVDLVNQFNEAKTLLGLAGSEDGKIAFETCADCLNAVINGTTVEDYVRNEIENGRGEEEEDPLTLFDQFAKDFGEGNC